MDGNISKAALKQKIKSLIAEIGLTPSLKGTPHFDFFQQVIARHPEQWGKADDIGIRQNPVFYSTEVFGVWGGKTYPVSMDKCINMKLPSTRAEMYEAMRNTINDQILAYRATCDVIECAFCQSTVRVEVDHIILFSDLVKQFLNDRTDLPKSFGRNNGSAVILKPGSFCDEWQAFHQDHATLRLLCRECNGARNVNERTEVASSAPQP